uniref:Uncharacterized protein n=1 Tax=Myoviridae sp. ctP6q2 TaxID=2825096 RepID=A0A8S5UUS5_9CAUD|nr:MAG TPA: hypothetical protein [Myoviridae sp. ctP6q2]
MGIMTVCFKLLYSYFYNGFCASIILYRLFPYSYCEFSVNNVL